MILLTGATGFLGSHVCATLLEKGYPVRTCKRKSSSLQEFDQILAWRLGADWKTKFQEPEWVDADVLDYDTLLEATQGVEAVFHVAAIVSFWSKRRDELYEINVQGTANVVNACLESEVPWLIHTSSIAAIGRDEKKPDVSEDNDWVNTPNNSQYAISKHLAELEVWRGREEGLKASMVNPGVILGEGDWTKGSCRLLKKIADGLAYYPESRNGYVDVLDVAEALVALYHKKIDGERFILVGENLSAKELIDMGAETFGHKKASIKISPWILRFGAGISTLVSLLSGKEPLITKETANTASHSYNYSTKKSQNTLGIDYHPIQSIFSRIKSII